MKDLIGKMPKILKTAVLRFFKINGTQRAAAFAYSAFFSFFPLMIILVTITSLFIDNNMAANALIEYIKRYIPISGSMQTYIFDAMEGVVKIRVQAGSIMFLFLIWVSIQFFITLIAATNKAWGSKPHDWWLSPLKSLVLFGYVGGAMFLGMGIPMLMRMIKVWLFPHSIIISWIYPIGLFLVPWLIMFIGLSFFYKLAPRRRTRLREVWLGALVSTVFLQVGGNLFVLYLKEFSSLNVVYGTFGGIMALLLWIYLSGCIIIFGSCFCAAQFEAKTQITPPHKHSL
ncbi:MAG: YihY/virulence factor BrkB family protein [Elusimicrobiota bacterium]|nr:YihY/virulence factor BrkB family protein [Elusimicrobiota bacterium]